MDIRLGQAVLDRYFRTYNAGDEAAHLACLHPEVILFASGSGDAVGRVAAQGIYRAAKSSLDLLEMHPIEVVGLHPELAVRTEIRGRSRRFLAVLVFRIDEQGAIRRLSLIYNLKEAFPPGA